MPTFKSQVFDGRSDISPGTVDIPNLDAARREGIRREGATLVLDAHILAHTNNWRMDVADENSTLPFRYDFAMTIAPAARGL